MKYEKFENDCYNLYTIKVDKFRHCHLEIFFRNKCTKEYLTYVKMLMGVLLDSNKEYNTRRLLTTKIQDLYSCNTFSSNSRCGDTLLTDLGCVFLNPKYIEDKTFTDQAIKFVFDLLFNPNVSYDEFDEKVFNKIKKQMVDNIEFEKENPKQQSIRSALKNLDNAGPRAYSYNGELQLINKMTPKKLYEFYQKFIEESIVDIYFIGNVDGEEIKNIVKKYCKFNSIKTTKTNLYLDELDVKKIKKVKDTAEGSQTNIVEIYTTKNMTERERDYVIPVFNTIWGGLSLNSKLYKKLRVENSLCYNINVFYQKFDNIFILHTAVDNSSYDKAIKLIKEALDDMINGNITEEEIKNAQVTLTNSLQLTYDDPGRIIDEYLFSNINDLQPIEKRIEEFNSVTLEEIKQAAKKIKLALIYKMGEDNGKN